MPSPRLVRMENVVLGLHRDMARLPAIGRGARVGRERAGRSLVVEERISPAAGLGKPLAILLDDEGLAEYVGHIDVEGRLRALLRLPLQLHDPRPLGERLAVA